jgi:pyruvate,water dikinase
MYINPSVSVENLGGKGYQLMLLKEICSVPDFFVLSFDSEAEINSENVQNKIFDVFDSHAFEYVSVRSSATVEDSSLASFAGIFESELNVKKEGLIQAVRSVLSSLANERVIDYCSINHVDLESIKMRVVVQKMINSRISGVCITKERKDSRTLLLEVCLGLGEALVSGLVTPDTYKINRRTFDVEYEFVGYQKTMILGFDKDKIVPVPFFQRNANKMHYGELIEIAKWCLEIERQFDYESADIEWAYEGSVPYILQVRPYVGYT